VKGRKHTPEQVVRKLREADRLLGEGKSVAEVAKALEISEHTFSRWRNQYGGMKADDAKDLRRLRDENARLKRLVADLTLDNEMLKEVARDAPIDCQVVSATKSVLRAWNTSRARYRLRHRMISGMDMPAAVRRLA
jgi:putative transposase